MAFKPVLRDWTSKPPVGIPVRRDGHWSTLGMLLCSAFNEQTGVPFELNNSARIPLTLGTGCSGHWASDGYSLVNSGSNVAKIEYRTPLPSDRCLSMTEGTIFLVSTNLGATTVDQGVFQASDGGSNRRWILHMGTVSGTYGIRIHAGGAYRDIVSSGVPRFVPHTTVYTWKNGSENGSGWHDGVKRLAWAGGTVQSANFSTVPLQGNCMHHIIITFNRALTDEEIIALTANPWQVFQPQITWKQTSSGVSETLTSTIISLAAVTDAQDYLEAATSLIQSGASANDVQTMIESVLTLAQVQASVTDIAQMVEACLTTIGSTSTVSDALGLVENLTTTIQSQSTATDILQAVETLQTTAQSAATVSDVGQAVETLLTTVQSAASVTDTLQAGQTFSENLLTTAISISQANEAQTFVDTINTVIQSGATLSELAGLVESIGSTVQSISVVAEQQLFVENISIMAVSGASLIEIGVWIDQVSATARSQASLVDVLVEAFVGKYIFMDIASSRGLANECTRLILVDMVRPRIFRDICSPRGRA